MNSVTTILIALAAFLAVACGGGKTNDDPAVPPPETTNPIDNPVHEAPQAVADGLILTLSLDKPIYTPGETVTLTARVENQRATPVNYWLSDPCSTAVVLFVDARPYANEAEHLPLPTSDRICPAVIVQQTIMPAETIQLEWKWDQIISAGSANLVLPNGTYPIRARFHMYEDGGLPNFSVPDLVATIDATIAQSADVISAHAALMSGLAAPEIAAWYAAGGSDLYCHLPGPTYYRVHNGTADVIALPAFDGAIAEGTAAQCYLRLRTDLSWELRVASKNPATPIDATVLVDGRTGAITG